ncbi:MAG: cation-translocating P-type ATPase, partial [Chloroflexi bacterium]|nr:cation-translocating P-type ATPase [Chloroflexota bacterium]
MLQQEVPVTAPSSEFATAGHTDSTVLTLGGLWCASCAWLVDETLRRTPGVVDVDVSFGQQQARLVYDPERTSPSRCARQVRRLGYRAALPGERLDDEEEALFNRLLIGGIFAMHDMVLGAMIYGRELLGWATADTAWLVRIFQYMMLLGAVPLLVVLGVPIIRAGLAGLLRGRPNMHTLVALGALAAFALSVRNLVVGSDRVYFDTASMLLFLVTVGRWLEMQAQKSGRDAVTRMERRIPAQATWITPDGNRRVDAAGIPKGARVRIGRGESFPVDGVVVAGEGDVDESLLTGEATPVTRRAGERVLAGATSLDGEFEVVTTAAGSATVAGQITRTLHDALWQRAPVERLADRLSALMVPVAAGIAGLTFGFWAARSGPDAALLHALSVLLIACP